MRYIPIRVCSKRKSSIARGTLDQIYTCHMLQAFFKRFDDYCVLSRKLGICYAGDILDNYGDYEEKSPGELLAVLKVQASDYRGITFLYWNHRPKTHAGFVRLMRDAGFNVLEFRRLDQIEVFLREKEADCSEMDIPANHVNTDGFASLLDFTGD